MKVKQISYTHRPNSGAHIAIPLLLLFAAIVAVVIWSQP